MALFLSACGGSGASPVLSAPPASASPGSTGSAPAVVVPEVLGPDCAGGQELSGDVDRAAGSPIDPIQALHDDFEGLLTTDHVSLGSHEGRPAVIVTREQRVVFIGSYGQDGRIYQYTGCADADIRLRGS